MTQPFDTVRVCCIGAESTGKSTLVKALATRHAMPWIGEYGRDYTIAKKVAGTNDQWDTPDFLAIAVEQQNLEDRFSTDRMLFCDTDAMSTDLWHERYLGRRNAAVDAVARMRTYDLFVLCDLDIPWEADEIRLGSDSRAQMHQRFLDVLGDERPEAVVLVAGDVETRMNIVDREVERLKLLEPSYMQARHRTADGFRLRH